MPRPSPRWRKMQPIYRYFARGCGELDFSEEAALGMYLYESCGTPLSQPWGNGYFVGKHWLDVTVASWRIDIRDGLLLRVELEEDPELSEWVWWLRSCLAGVVPRAPVLPGLVGGG